MAKPHLRSPHPRQYDSRPSRDMAESLVASYPPEEPHSAIIDLRAFEPWWYREGGREWYMDRLYHKSNRLYNSALRFCAAPGNGLLDVWEFLSKRLPACCYGSMEGWWIVGCDPEGCFCKTEYLRAKCPVGPHCVYYTEQYLYYWWRAQRALERIDALIERGQIFVSQAFDDERWDESPLPGAGTLAPRDGDVPVLPITRELRRRARRYRPHAPLPSVRGGHHAAIG